MAQVQKKSDGIYHPHLSSSRKCVYKAPGQTGRDSRELGWSIEPVLTSWHGLKLSQGMDTVTEEAALVFKF